MNKFIMIECKTFPSYIIPDHVAFIEYKSRMTFIHLVSGDVVETTLPIPQVLSLLSQQ